MPDHLFSRRKRGSSGSWQGFPAMVTARDYERPHQLPKTSSTARPEPSTLRAPPGEGPNRGTYPRWDDAGGRAGDQDAADELGQGMGLGTLEPIATLVVGGLMIADLVKHPGELSAVLRATSRLAGQAIRDLGAQPPGE